MPLRIFPVSGGARYSDDFSAEATETSRKHLGNDLLAPAGTPLFAVDDGDVRFGTDPLGGNVANLRSPDGTRYYYAHLSAYEGGNRRVSAGEVIGYIGTTGNAAGGPPHTHFEMHPGGGAAVNPYPHLRAASVRTGSSKGSSASASWLLPALVIAAGGYWIYATEPAAKRWVYKWL